MEPAKQALSGQCQCGKIRYRINGEAITLYACHCLDCQTQSGSAFGLSMWVYFDDFELLRGELKFWRTKADNETEKQCAFCPDCGTRIYHASNQSIISLKAGTLDQKLGLSPVAHIWTKRAHEWLALETMSAICCTEQPDHLDEFFSAWKNRGKQ